MSQIAAQLTCTFDHRLGLAVQEGLAVLLLAAEREGDRLEKQQDIVLLAFFVNALDQLELSLGTGRLGRLEGGQQFDGVRAAALDLADAPAGLDVHDRSADGVLRTARLFHTDEDADVLADAEAGHAVPDAVVAIDQHGAGVLGQGVGQDDLGFDDFGEGRFAFFSLLFQAVLDHADHGAVLVGSDHGQRTVVVADPLQAAQLARGQTQAEQAGDTVGAAGI